MTRVFHVLAGAAQGGAELFVERLCLALQRRVVHGGVEQRVAIRSDAARAARLRAGGIEPLELKFGGPFDLATRAQLKRAFAAFKPDVVLSYMNRATQKTPRGDFVHVARLGGYYDLKYYRHCDHLIANTADIGAYLVKAGWPADKLSVIGNFVSAQPAPPPDRRAHATPDGAKLIAAFGRLHPNKGFDVLLRALAALPGVYLWLAGEGPERAALDALAKQLGIAERVRWLGWQTDTAPIFAAADVICVPSRHEPLGNVVLEAWIHGKPVVATASQGPAQLIAHDASGLLVPVDDAPALSAALGRVLADKNLAESLAAGGRAAAARDFTESAIVQQYVDLFARLSAARRA